jgi:hypothetical protein
MKDYNHENNKTLKGKLKTQEDGKTSHIYESAELKS